MFAVLLLLKAAEHKRPYSTDTTMVNSGTPKHEALHKSRNRMIP